MSSTASLINAASLPLLYRNELRYVCCWQSSGRGRLQQTSRIVGGLECSIIHRVCATLARSYSSATQYEFRTTATCRQSTTTVAYSERPLNPCRSKHPLRLARIWATRTVAWTSLEANWCAARPNSPSSFQDFPCYQIPLPLRDSARHDVLQEQALISCW